MDDGIFGWPEAAAARKDRFGQLLKCGFRLLPFPIGVIPPTFNPDPGYGQEQFGTNNAAIIINPPIADGVIDVWVVNSATAGAITFGTGFSVSALTGDVLTTTAGNQFIIQLRRCNGVSTYFIKALQ
jgi:hypothetical protein